MLEYDRIDISEGIDVNKYEPYLCNGCHDLMQKAMTFNDVAMVSIKQVWYNKNLSLKFL